MPATLELALDADVSLARGGDLDAFARLVRQTSAMVSSIALAIVRDVGASEDIAQDVYLAAWKGLRTLRNTASFLPWLRQLTRNHAHSWLRRLGSRPTPIGNDEDHLAAVASTAPSPERDAEARQQRRLLARALETIPDEAREVLVLYYREGQSTRQVGALLGLSEAAVRQRLSRARALVAERVREDVGASIGATLRESAPGAAMVTSVLAAIATTTGPASAAVASGAGVAKVGVAAAAGAAAGVVAGIGGVVLGLRRDFAEAGDSVELTRLRRFRAVAISSVIAAGVGLVLTADSRHWAPPVLVYSAFLLTLAILYFGWLPTIRAARWQAERAADPTAERRHRRRRIGAIVGYVAGAVSGGLGLLAGLLLSARL